jgi:hypothetical protein
MHVGHEFLVFRIIACLCAILFATNLNAGDEPRQGSVELTLPHGIAADEVVGLKVSVGPLPPGARVRISTDKGAQVGVVSPPGARQAQQPATYTLLLPKGAVVDGRVRLRLEISEQGAPPRAPRPGEVEDVKLIHEPVTK